MVMMVRQLTHCWSDGLWRAQGIVMGAPSAPVPSVIGARQGRPDPVTLALVVQLY